ncbi:MAG: universal stress protein [Rhizobiaceae bacterium]
MYKKIMTPVDLRHVDDIEKALKCSADLATHYDAEIIYVGVTSSAPSDIAHNPDEYSRLLDTFTKRQMEKHSISARSETQVCNDPATEVDDALLAAVETTGADLVVMQSHLPSLTDYIWPSNGGKIARHGKASVMIVRD